MSKKNAAPTMKDVAREAGVSLGTVSKVINKKAVGEEYVKRVEAAIKKLDYHVNSYAQGLKASHTYTVALLVPTVIHPFFGSLAFHVNKVLLKRGYRMLLCCSEFDPGLEQEYIDMVQQNKVDGIIILSYNPAPSIAQTVPVVSIDRYLGEHIPVVSCDNYAGGRLAAEHLHTLGHKRVAFLREGSAFSSETDKRKDGFINACASLDMTCDLCYLNDHHTDTAFRDFICAHIHDGKLDFSGIFCVTDVLVYKIKKLLTELHFHVPNDVALIGFDGIRHFGSYDYTCSTIVQPVEDMAEMAVELLLQDVLKVRPHLVCLPVHFAEGGTT